MLELISITKVSAAPKEEADQGPVPAWVSLEAAFSQDPLLLPMFISIGGSKGVGEPVRESSDPGSSPGSSTNNWMTVTSPFISLSFSVHKFKSKDDRLYNLKSLFQVSYFIILHWISSVSKMASTKHLPVRRSVKGELSGPTGLGNTAYENAPCPLKRFTVGTSLWKTVNT